jgi:hypothetical protein
MASPRSSATSSRRDAYQLLNNLEAVVGRDAIQRDFAQLAAAFDTSAYAPRYDIIDVHDDHAYVLGSFDEALRPRAGGWDARSR